MFNLWWFDTKPKSYEILETNISEWYITVKPGLPQASKVESFPTIVNNKKLMFVGILAMPLLIFVLLLALFDFELFKLTSYSSFVIITQRGTSQILKKNTPKGKPNLISQEKGVHILTSKCCDTFYLFHKKSMALSSIKTLFQVNRLVYIATCTYQFC